MKYDKETDGQPALDFSFESNHSHQPASSSGKTGERPEVIELTHLVERGPGFEEDPEAITLSDLDLAFEPDEVPAPQSKERPHPQTAAEGASVPFPERYLSSEAEDIYVLPENDLSASGLSRDFPPAPPQEQPIALEERLERMIRRVVQETVERVARETMTTVAEKLIRETINSLKESLGPAGD